MALPALLGAGLKSMGGGLVKGAAKGAATNFIKGKKTKVKPDAVKGAKGEKEEEVKSGGLAIRPKTTLIPSSALAPIPAPIQEPTSSGSGEKTEQDTILIIREKVIEINKILKGTLAADKARSKSERTGLEKQKRKKQETGLEKLTPSKDKKAGKKFNVPGKGLLSGIFDFFKNIFLGAFLIQLTTIKLPGGQSLLGFIGGSVTFIVDLVLGILDAAGTFLAVGQDMYDATEGFLKDKFGDGAAETFNGFMSNLNKVFNLIGIIGLLSAAFNPFEGLKDLVEGRKPTEIDPKTGKPKLKPGEGVDADGKTRRIKVDEIVEPDGKIRAKTNVEKNLQKKYGFADNQIDAFTQAKQANVATPDALNTARKVTPVTPAKPGGFLGFLDDVGKKTTQATDFLGKQAVGAAKSVGGAIVSGAKATGGVIASGAKAIDNLTGNVASKAFSNAGKAISEKYKSATAGLGNLIDAGKKLAVENLIKPLRPIIEPIAKTLQGFSDSIFKNLAKLPIVQKLLQAFAKKGGVKVGLKELGSKILEKLGSKVLPVVGGFVNLAFGYDRLAKGDSFGSLIEMMAGVADIASIFPGLQPLGVLSTALDGYMFVRDMGPALLGDSFDIKAGEDLIFKKLGLGGIKGQIDAFASKLPDLGTIVAMIKGEDVKQKSPEEIAKAKAAEGNNPSTSSQAHSPDLSGSVKTGDLDPNSGASNVSGEAGKFIEQNLDSAATAADGYGDYNAIIEHPDFGGVRGSHASGSYHYSGRAIDVGAFTNEQAPIVDVINQFNKKKGVQPAEMITGASFPGSTMVDPGGHGDHVHLAYGLGGLVRGLTHAMLGEKGKEFVIDNDSYTAIEGAYPGLFDAINKAKGKDAVEALMAYTDYERPPEPEMAMMGGGSGGGSGSYGDSGESGMVSSNVSEESSATDSSWKDIRYKFG